MGDVTPQPSSSAEGRPVENTSKRKRTTRATSQQMEALLAKLEERPFLATKRYTSLQGRETFQEAWQEVAADLNAIHNGSHKTPEQWITVWRDFKSRACTKAAKLRKERVETGNREINCPPLTEIEKRIISLIGSDYTVGTNCPDSMPEDNTSQIQLEAGESVPEAQLIDEGSSEIVPGSVIEEMEVQIASEQMTPLPQTATTSGTSNSNRVRTSSSTQDQVQPRRNRNLNPRRSVAEQHSSARADFLAVAQSNAESMRMLAGAAQQQAEAAKIQAEAAKMQAEASLAFAQAANKIADAIIIFVEKNK